MSDFAINSTKVRLVTRAVAAEANGSYEASAVEYLQSARGFCPVARDARYLRVACWPSRPIGARRDGVVYGRRSEGGIVCVCDLVSEPMGRIDRGGP